MNKDLKSRIKELSLKDKKTLSQKALKVGEEFGELARKVLPFDNAPGTTHRFIDKKKILDEVADLYLTSISIAYDLGFTDEEIEDTIEHKTRKWMELQSKESKVDYPIPYETHITVKRPKNINDFIGACDMISKEDMKNKIKPIVLDLQNGGGKSVMKDVMTSSKHIGDNNSAYEVAMKLHFHLSSYGFEVLRVKIETVPWHPAAPTRSDIDPQMPKDCYFEAHVGVMMDGTKSQNKKLETALKDHDVHLSKNFFKKNEDGSFTLMITYRSYDSVYEDFMEELENIKSALLKNDFEYEKVITEFSIYDTKISHDFLWLEKGEVHA